MGRTLLLYILYYINIFFYWKFSLSHTLTHTPVVIIIVTVLERSSGFVWFGCRSKLNKKVKEVQKTIVFMMCSFRVAKERERE